MKKPEGNANNGNGNGKGNGKKLDSFSVLKVRMFDNGGVMADLELNGVTVYGVRVVEGKNGDFLSLPQRKGGDGKYYHICYWPFCEEDMKAVIGEIERKLNE